MRVEEARMEKRKEKEYRWGVRMFYTSAITMGAINHMYNTMTRVLKDF